MNMSLMNTSTRQYEHINFSDYEVIDFVCKESNFNQRKRAWRVGGWLVVSTTLQKKYKIYRIDNGKPVLEMLIENPKEAVLVAQCLSDIYEEYFPIWEAYPDADIFTLAQWSVQHGVNINEVIKDAEAEKNAKILIERIV